MAGPANPWRQRAREFRESWREPLPGAEGMSKWQRFGARTRHLVGRYGWRFVLVVVVYYLIRDLILYVILPYLVAQRLIID